MLIIEDTRLCPVRAYFYCKRNIKEKKLIGLYDKLKRSYSKMITDDELICLVSKSYFIDAVKHLNHSIVENYLIAYVNKQKTFCDFTFSFDDAW